MAIIATDLLVAIATLNAKAMQGCGFVNLPSLLCHPYLVCILFGMPSRATGKHGNAGTETGTGTGTGTGRDAQNGSQYF